MNVSVLGSINRDLVLRVERLPAPGETLAAQSLTYLPGGKGANQAVAAARFGATTRMIGAVGKDEHGLVLRSFLREAGVDTEDVAIVDGRTGLAFVSVADTGENQIVIHAGANAVVTAPRPNSRAGAGGVALAQLELPLHAVAGFFDVATSSGAYCILNAAPAVAGAEALFDRLDLLVVNETELGFFLGTGLPQDREAIVRGARGLLRRAGQYVIVTLGGEGALGIGADEVIEVPAERVPVVDTTGAGDCFCGVLAAAIAERIPLSTALRLAGRAASLSVQRVGAASSMPLRAEILPDTVHG